MKKLIIIGAGGFGREVLSWARQCAEFRRDWEVGGFLDDNPAALDAFDVGLPILGSVDGYEPGHGDLFICAIGKPEIKRACVEKVSAKGGVFTCLIHPSVIFGERVALGEGVILCPRATLTCDIHVGHHSALNLFTAVGHDARMGDFCQMHSYSELCGEVVLEDEVLVGTHATILPRGRVGRGSIVGAGSVVVGKVPAGVSVHGSPARLLTRR